MTPCTPPTKDNPMRITVYGRPITQGSKIRTRWSMRDSNSDTLIPWRDNVRAAAVNNIDDLGCGYESDPVNVQITFTFDRPNSHFGTGKNKKIVKTSAPPFPSSHAAGDIDKLARACLDALTDAGVWRDDSQVVDIHATKIWAGTVGALDRPGAVINVAAANVRVGSHACEPAAS